MRVVILRFALVVAVLLTVSVASADHNWTRPAASGVGDWGDAANWDTPPGTDRYTYMGVAGTNADIEVTGAEIYSEQMVLGSTYPASSSAPLLTIKSGGSLSQGTYLTGRHSYVGRNNIGHMIIEAGGTWSTPAKLYIATYPGSTGTVDVYGTLDLSAGSGKLNFGDTAGSTASGTLNIYGGGVVKLSTFQDTFKGFELSALSADANINIYGSGKMVHAGNSLSYAELILAAGILSGNGVLGNVVAAYVDGETTITAVPVSDMPLKVNVGADQGYTRGLALLILEATVVDDELPAAAVLAWSQTDGPGAATFASPNSAITVVDFDAGGVYTLRLTADNTAGGGSESVYDELEVTASNPTCQDLIGHNQLLAGDVNGDCYVNLADVAEIAAALMTCNNPQDASCDWAWE